jgi:hypothetical protein
MHSLSEWEAAIVLTGLALATLFGWIKVVRPRIRRVVHKFTAASDSILGREAVVDSITGVERSPALPGIGVRMADVENHVAGMASALQSIAASHVVLEDHEHRLVRLEEAAVERVVSRAESAAAWGAMQAASESTPPEVKP